MTTTYGCHNRAPITTICAPTCQYTYTDLGQADTRCHGCCERVPLVPMEIGRIDGVLFIKAKRFGGVISGSRGALPP